MHKTIFGLLKIVSDGNQRVSLLTLPRKTIFQASQDPLNSDNSN